MFGDILQPTHLLFVLVVALLVLGPKRLPEVGRTLGSGLRDFREAISGESHDRPARTERPEPEWVHAPAEPAPTQATATEHATVAPDATAGHETAMPDDLQFPSAFDAPGGAGAAAEPAHADSTAEHTEPADHTEPTRTEPTV